MTAAERTDPEIRAQIERAMADPMRVMPSEREALERMGFRPVTMALWEKLKRHDTLA